ncbi:unnamed protein product, partial [Didymodactylos carnosus]
RQIQKDEVQRKQVEIVYYKKRMKEFERQIKNQMGSDESQSDDERHEFEANPLTKRNLETIDEDDNNQANDTESARIANIKGREPDEGLTTATIEEPVNQTLFIQILT